MAGQVANQPASPFDFEIIEGDPGDNRTVITSSNGINPWIDPAKIKLGHRIGRGPFGDVWLATQHRSSEDYEEYHEVSVKMLRPIKEDSIGDALNKLDYLMSKCQGLETVCWLYGLSVINKKAIVGDVGIPYALLEISLPSSDMARRLGTPNYMAPEQWEPEVRGPISVETDSWGFGCSILEMLTGVQPWNGKSADEMYKLVVNKQEKPPIPTGLPPAVENVIIGCFEYDFRSRPVMADILHAFKSSQNAVYQDGVWTGIGSRMIGDKPSGVGYTEWFLAKDHLQVLDTVRSRKSPNSHNLVNMNIPEGSVVGLERDSDQDGYVLVRVHGIHDPIRVHVSTLERVTFGLAAGDWVRLKKEDKKHSPVGILHSINHDGRVDVAFIGLETLWKGNYLEFQMAKPYCVGQFVKLKSSVFSPRFEWPQKRGGEWATGRICQVLPNGCLIVKFPGRLTIGDEKSSFLADPAEAELISFDTCPTVVKKYQHLEDFHWAIRPMLIALGLFTAMKFGLFVGKKVGRSKGKKEKGNSGVQNENQTMDGQSSSNTAWHPRKVANIFR